MEFDRFTIALLILREDAPQLGSEEADRLQDAHMTYLAELHEAGVLLAAGPVSGAVDRRLRGLNILSVDAEEAIRVTSSDPAVVAGRFRVEVHPWMVPAGAVHFTPTRFPHSQAEL